MIISFSGHRPSKIGGFIIPNPIYIAIYKKMIEVLEELKPTQAISGMALGVDQMGAEACLDLGIPFIAAVPFKGQETRWPAKSQEYYRKLLGNAKEIVIVSEGEYSPAKMQTRNCWMIDHSDHVIGVFDGSPGGTANCLRYAKEIGRPMTIINPKDLCPDLP